MVIRFNSIAFIFLIILCSCGNKRPTHESVIGTWLNADGAQLVLKPNGTFLGSSLPCTLFWGEPVTKKTFDGSGTWKIEEVQSKWEISLTFYKNNYENIELDNFVILSRGDDSGPAANWYMYKWIVEEGGDRYEFHKNK